MSKAIFIWTYSTSDVQREAFIAEYDASGGWARWFKHAAGFIELGLVEITQNIFLVWELWADQDARTLFIKENESEYQERCNLTSHLYECETAMRAMG